MIVDLSHRAHGRARVSDRIGLVNRDSGRHTFDFVDLRAIHTVHELANVGAESFDIAALAFSIKGVKNQRGPVSYTHLDVYKRQR